MNNILVSIPKGAPWLPEYEKVQHWGGWSNKGDAERNLREANSQQNWFSSNGYPGSSSWIKDDYFSTSTGLCSTTLFFILPDKEHVRIFGPRYNEYGEVSP